MGYSDDILGGSETVPLDGSIAATTSEDVLIGARLDDRFVILRKLGKGSFGAVYLASDEKMYSRKVVVKVMRDENLQNEWSVKSFQREIEALTQIKHSGVVGVFDCGESPDGKGYIVMEYVDGVSLRSLMTQEGMQFGQAARIIGQMGRALSAAHSVGILHRDLKPENVMVEDPNKDDELVKIIDFGVAKVKNSIIPMSTAAGQLVGTVLYMSPEQLTSQPLKPASDIYSMGVVAYEMLTGQRPTNPDSAFQLLDLQRSGISKPTNLRPDIPPGAESIILRALSFEPDDRYESAREFGDLLSNALLGKDEPNDMTATPEPVEADGTSPPHELAHVLFMDLVRYTALLIEEMNVRLQELNEIVRQTHEFKTAQSAGKLKALHTGDGMILSFFGDLESPVRCAAEISKALRDHPKIKLRMGVHSGLVSRITVITGDNLNGPGINFAQRVMDCGDAGHILLSKSVADQLRKVRRWANDLHDLGEARDKNDNLVHVYSLYNEEIGNSEVPSKLRQAKPKPSRMKRWPALAAAVIVVVASLFWVLSRLRNVPTPVRERVFTYFLVPTDTVGTPQEVRFAGNELFHNGSRFTFVLTPEQPGYLYLLDKGAGPDGKPALNVLFPTPKKNNGSALAAANQRLEVGIHFDSFSGEENLSMIWTSQPVSELETIFKDAARTDWEIKNPDQIKTATEFLNQHQSPAPRMDVDPDKKQTTVRGQAELFISTRLLQHRDY